MRKHHMKTTARLSVSSFICAALVSSGAFQNSSIRAIKATMAISAAKTVSQPRKIKALAGGTLIDGYGGRPLRNSVIIIEGERVKAVGQVGALPIPEDAELISTEGMTVLPGLWDMHVHLMINGHAD